MLKATSVILILFFSFMSCKKDNDIYTTGTIIEKKGCFPDSYLVAIENPDLSKHSFLRATVLSCAACYNCSNAVFMRLSSPFTTAGTRIRFSYAETEISCLSTSEAPPHIQVKKISKL